MKRFALGLILLLGLVPLTACNQNTNKAPGVHEQHERGGLGERRERGMRGERRGGGRGRLRQACADDIAKYCSGMDRPRLKRQCLRTHVDQLSTDCKAAIEKGGEGRRRRDF
jgi:hypothetical protein